MNYILLIQSRDQEALRKFLEPHFSVVFVDPNVPLMVQISKLKPQLFIADATLLLEDAQGNFTQIKKDRLYHDLPVVAYCSDESSDVRAKLFDLSIKAIIDKNDNIEKITAQIEQVLARVNLYVGTMRDRFIKAFLGYEEAHTLINETLYLANYLIAYYKLKPQQASDVRLVIVLLTVGFKKHKIRKVLQLVSDLDFKQEIIDYIKTYHKHETVETAIILSSLMMIDDETHATLLKPAFDSMDASMREVVAAAMEQHKMYISCTHDIYVFAMRLNVLFGETHGALAQIDFFVKRLVDTLSFLLTKHSSLLVAIEVTPKLYCCTLTIEDTQFALSEDELAVIEANEHDFIFEVDASKLKFSACLNIPALPKEAHQEKTSCELPPMASQEACANDYKCQIDLSAKAHMHYEDHEKISAKAFLQEFEYDQFLMDELSESESDAKDALYFNDDLSAETMESIIDTLSRYTHVFNETIEFRDLAFSVDSLIQLIGSLDVMGLEKSTRKQLKAYLEGIFENLANWKQHIFITQESPDIHYLDASLLNDCAQVESLFNPQVGEDESDLEFF